MATLIAPARRPRIFHALEHRDFRLLWSGQTVSLIGNTAFITALGWRTFTLAGSTKFGFVLVAESVSTLATLLIGGALADRYSRRALMIVSDLARFGAVGGLALTDATGHLTFPLILLFTTLVGLGDGFFYPAFGGIVPLVVEPPSLGSANALIGVSRYGSFLVGPVLAAFLYHSTGPALVFGLDSVSFVVSAFLLYLARPRLIDVEAREGTFREIRAGFRYVRGVPWLWVTIAMFSLVLMLQLAPQQVLLPKLVKEHFGRGIGSYGVLTALLGLGMVLGTVLFGQLNPRRRRGTLSYVVWCANSLSIIGLVLSPWYELALVFAVIRGALIGFGTALWDTMLMELVPEGLLSRVVSLDIFGSFGLMPIGLLTAALVSTLAPPGPIIAVGASVSAILFAVMLTRPWLRKVE
jgi:MFS family permease